eukprot:2956032-Alexandrium_andersonii.AAC.1
MLGYKRIVVRSGQEPTILSFVRKVKQLASCEVVPEGSPCAPIAEPGQRRAGPPGGRRVLPGHEERAGAQTHGEDRRAPFVGPLDGA